MLTRIRRSKRGQSLVIVALSATALFGIIALGLDAGRLYFQRRDVQNAADAGALAGAQELIPNGAFTQPTTAMITAAGCQASVYALQGLLKTPRDGGCSPTPSPAYTPASLGAGISEPSSDGTATVQVWTPSRNNPNEVHVRVTFNVPLTFAAILGFTTSAVVADAYAHNGFKNNTYTVFGFDAGGSGNSVNYDQNGNAQIDNGNNGTDMCNPSAVKGKMVSNAKWHAPNPNGGWLNLNGQFFYAQASDTHALVLYWYSNVTVGQGNEPAPFYVAPVKPTTWTAPSTTSYNGKTVHVFYPGLYTSNVTIPGSYGGANDIYRFMNGIYYFQNANLTINGGTVGNTMSGGPTTGKRGPNTGVPASDLGPSATDGVTDGVEFVFDGSATFNAASGKSSSPSVFFVSPYTNGQGGTADIAFFIKSTDTISGPNGTPWVEQINGNLPTDGGFPFQVWGAVYNADQNGSHGTGVVLQAVSTSVYAVNGEMVSPQVDLDGGGINGTTGSYTASNPGTPPPSAQCNKNGYVQNTAGYLVQFNPEYVPQFTGYAYLVR